MDVIVGSLRGLGYSTIPMFLFEDVSMHNIMVGCVPILYAGLLSSEGETFIIDGRRLKSINQWFNKKNARLQSIKDRQDYGRKPTNRQKALARRRNNRINDYMNKAARRVIDYFIDHDIGTLVVGYNETFQKGSNIGKRNNQIFINIPYGKLIDKLKYLCELNDIILVMQEESYTSKASFWIYLSGS